MIKTSRSFALVIALSLWARDALACSSEFCPNDPSAVTFDGSDGLSTVSINNAPAYAGSIFISVWVRWTLGGLNNQGLLQATGASGDVMYLGFGTATVELQYSFTYSNGGGIANAGGTLVTGVGIPADSNWHHLVIDVTDVAGTPTLIGGSSYSYAPVAQYSIDGSIGSMTNQASGEFVTSNLTSVLGVSTSSMNSWTVGTWPFGGTLTGDVAEWYLNFSPFPGGSLTSLIVAKFRDSSTGKAVGLGANCSGPTGSVSNMCDRGDPCDFIFGPRPNSAPSYVLRRSSSASQPLLNGADTDPCLTDGKGQGCAPNK